ncbi:MAG: hypothetical protein ACRBFS_18745 [Aureispira sp.]
MLLNYLIILSVGLVAASMIIVLGAITSRLYNIKFFYWSICSFAVYLGVSYWATLTLNPMAGITIVGLIGLFEATVGIKLVLHFRANIDHVTDKEENVLVQNYPPTPTLTLTIVFIYLFIGWLGTLLV